jgi:hypothetical protein
MIMRRVLPFFAVSALLLTIGCGGGGNNVPGGASNVYVVQNGSTSSILEFPASALSSATPSNTITIPMQTTFCAVAVDASGNLYVSASTVANPTLYQVLVYAPGATGNATATRTITGFSNYVVSLAVDSTGQLYALSGNTISVFAANATGNATPVRQITGSATLLNSPYSLAVDSAQNIYVANTEAENIVVFSASANGNVAPTRTIAGSNTQLYYSWGIAVDAAGDIFATTQNRTASPAVSSVLEFAPNANGNALPTMTLTDFAGDPIAGIDVDDAGNLYVLVIDNYLMTVDVFSAGASGGRAPEQNINSTAWTNSDYGQIAIQ